MRVKVGGPAVVRYCRPESPKDAMAMIYMIVTLVWLLIAMRFVDPTQLVSRVKEHPQRAG